jgi:hypothetical protein
MNSLPPISRTKFFGFLATTLLIFAIAIEAASWLLLTAMDAKVHPRYNRVVSGYSVFSATPDFTFLTSKTDASQADVVTDDYGFIHDEPIAMAKPEGTVRIILNGGPASPLCTERQESSQTPSTATRTASRASSSRT